MILCKKVEFWELEKEYNETMDSKEVVTSYKNFSLNPTLRTSYLEGGGLQHF
jgi:hypothetical protein